MFSQSFMKFLIGYTENENKNEENSVQEIEFKSVKVKEAAHVVIAAIKETY